MATLSDTELRAHASSACPDAATVQAWLERRIAPAAAAALRRHVDGCASCREWIAAAAAIDDDTAPRDSDPLLPVRGTEIGRYVVLDVLGRGGMGTVFAAWDPELDRKVALKLLRSDRVARPEDQRRLLREAQALAKLAHPHVVAVHDTGTLDGEVYVAMEFVDGASLRQWQRVAPRSWRELLRIYLQAGLGLAAAHDVGLVHRDFKPDNVLVGNDGRARVADFGLARSGEAEGEPATARDSGESSDFAGTPGYMAPEQRRGDPVDARADQFAFCRALHEALVGATDGPGPRWLHRVLQRGLADDASARWPSMPALARALRRDPGRTWRRAALASAA
ncbi:MAG: serine/threonine protein kinase, partial [Nannocystaceae bacterium]|nr:serine/threonine protein kinase [Nannocystaceae bacterium]